MLKKLLKSCRKAVKKVLDGKYETDGELDPLKPKLFGEPLRPLFVLGVGAQFKLNKKLSLEIENRFTLPAKSDLIDGKQWQSNSANEPAMTRDFDTYNFKKERQNNLTGVPPLFLECFK